MLVPPARFEESVQWYFIEANAENSLMNDEDREFLKKMTDDESSILSMYSINALSAPRRNDYENDSTFLVWKIRKTSR